MGVLFYFYLKERDSSTKPFVILENLQQNDQFLKV